MICGLKIQHHPKRSRTIEPLGFFQGSGNPLVHSVGHILAFRRFEHQTGIVAKPLETGRVDHRQRIIQVVRNLFGGKNLEIGEDTHSTSEPHVANANTDWQINRRDAEVGESLRAHDPQRRSTSLENRRIIESPPRNSISKTGFPASRLSAAATVTEKTLGQDCSRILAEFQVIFVGVQALACLRHEIRDPKNENGCRQETGTAWGNIRVNDVMNQQYFTEWSRRWRSPRTCHLVADWTNSGSERPTD